MIHGYIIVYPLQVVIKADYKLGMAVHTSNTSYMGG